jgi:competence ComEA-like helix-hairpin-helix protein
MKWKDFFTFSRSEKRGSIVLLLIILLLIITQFTVGYWERTVKADFSEFDAQVNAFLEEIENQQKQPKLELFPFNPNTISNEEWSKLGFKEWQIKSLNKYKKKGGSWKIKSDLKKLYGLTSEHYDQLEPYIILPESKSHDKTYRSNIIKQEYFEFNPNTISNQDWKRLGFKDWQIKSINNYKQKGGKWKQKEDLKKIYGVKETTYIALKPYILLPSKNDITKVNPIKQTIIDINSATARDLITLDGINSEKYAAIIINYRNSLGGFINKEQLLEVWNMERKTYDKFEDKFRIAPNSHHKLNINTLTNKELAKHPYINWKEANAIVKYRKANGKFNSVTDVQKIHLISDEIYPKIVPYLKIN